MLDTFVNRALDQAPYTGRILRYLISRYPQQSVPLFGQVTVATFIVLATFVSLMVLPIYLDDQFQGYTTKVGRVWWNRILATKLLVSAPSIANDLPHVTCKLVSANTLVSRKRDRIWVARRLVLLGVNASSSCPSLSTGGSAPSPPAPLPQQAACWGRGETE